MAKFKSGQKCLVIKNGLAPRCVGQEVEVIRTAREFTDGRVLYEINEGGLRGYAMESCLELIKEQ